jgi:hypothetical protein
LHVHFVPIHDLRLRILNSSKHPVQVRQAASQFAPASAAGSAASQQ